MTQPDMNKVAAAVAALEARRLAREGKAYSAAKAVDRTHVRESRTSSSLPAQDAAIRKPLRAHGNPCCGFNCSQFLNRD